jgi:hypothetical protein
LDDRDGSHHWLLDSETQDTLPEQIVGSGKSVLWFVISHHRIDESFMASGQLNQTEYFSALRDGGKSRCGMFLNGC